MNTKFPLYGIAFLLFVQTAQADVQVTIKDQDGTSLIKLSKVWAKMSNASLPGEYMLHNMQKDESFMVDSQSKMVVKLEQMGAGFSSASQQQQDGQKRPKVGMEKLGKGPEVAGYKTTHYRLKADGIACSDHYLSMEPMKLVEVKNFSEAMKKMAPADESPFFGDSPCGYAEMEFDRMVSKYGIPLLSTTPDGQETHRVVQLRSKISFPRSEFELPKGYTVVSQRELIQQQLQGAMSNRDGGGLSDMPSEEEMERMGDQVEENLKQLEMMMKQMAEQ